MSAYQTQKKQWVGNLRDFMNGVYTKDKKL